MGPFINVWSAFIYFFPFLCILVIHNLTERYAHISCTHAVLSKKNYSLILILFFNRTLSVQISKDRLRLRFLWLLLLANRLTYAQCENFSKYCRKRWKKETEKTRAKALAPFCRNDTSGSRIHVSVSQWTNEYVERTRKKTERQTSADIVFNNKRWREASMKLLDKIQIGRICKERGKMENSEQRMLWARNEYEKDGKTVLLIPVKRQWLVLPTNWGLSAAERKYAACLTVWRVSNSGRRGDHIDRAGEHVVWVVRKCTWRIKRELKNISRERTVVVRLWDNFRLWLVEWNEQLLLFHFFERKYQLMKWHTLRTVAIVCDYNYLESYNISIQKLGDFLSTYLRISWLLYSC